jgi:hypothetical protein
MLPPRYVFSRIRQTWAEIDMYYRRHSVRYHLVFRAQWDQNNNLMVMCAITSFDVIAMC